MAAGRGGGREVGIERLGSGGAGATASDTAEARGFEGRGTRRAMHRNGWDYCRSRLLRSPSGGPDDSGRSRPPTSIKGQRSSDGAARERRPLRAVTRGDKPHGRPIAAPATHLGRRRGRARPMPCRAHTNRGERRRRRWWVLDRPTGPGILFLMARECPRLSFGKDGGMPGSRQSKLPQSRLSGGLADWRSGAGLNEETSRVSQSDPAGRRTCEWKGKGAESMGREAG